MGEARRKRDRAAVAQQTGPTVDLADRTVRDRIAAAVRQVLTAVSDVHGADCGLYAAVGADLLRRLGHEAYAVAGSAAWRVGPGDGDVLSHAAELAGPRFAPAMRDRQGSAVPAGMFHAWVQTGHGTIPTAIIDFTTWQVARKAAALDAADGGHTTVTWHPPYLWVPREARVPLRAVAAAQAPPAFAYERHPAYERTVFAPPIRTSAATLAALALTVFQAQHAGTPLQVVGVDRDDPTVAFQVGVAEVTNASAVACAGNRSLAKELTLQRMDDR